MHYLLLKSIFWCTSLQFYDENFAHRGYWPLVHASGDWINKNKTEIAKAHNFRRSPEPIFLPIQ